MGSLGGGVNLSWQSLFECEINDRVHLCDVTLASLSANWPEAEETSLRAGTPLPNNDSHHSAFILAAHIGSTTGCENAGQGEEQPLPSTKIPQRFTLNQMIHPCDWAGN